MLVVCISASNMKNAGENSTSLKVCRLIEIMISREISKDACVETIALVDAELEPCTGCGGCFELGQCNASDDFNSIYSRIAGADAVFIVSPHYTPIPAKLSMLLEKMEQISFLRWFHDNTYRPAVYGIPVGIIAHGGGSDEIVLRSYKAMVLDTIANALQTIMMDVVGLDEEWPNGIVFPVKEVQKDEKGIFPVQLYDWKDIRDRIAPLVEKVMEKAGGRQ
jgi:multimeric flavodoxin WrbA